MCNTQPRCMYSAVHTLTHASARAPILEGRPRSREGNLDGKNAVRRRLLLTRGPGNGYHLHTTPEFQILSSGFWPLRQGLHDFTHTTMDRFLWRNPFCSQL